MLAIFFGLLKGAVAVMLLAIGAASSVRQVAYLWQRPALLSRALLAMYVLVPAAAVLIDEFVPLGNVARAALLVLAVSAGAPMLPRKLGAIGRSPYVFSLVVTSSFLAVAFVPVWVMVLGPHFELDRQVEPLQIAMSVAQTILLPLLAGMALRAMWPAICERWADRLIAALGSLLMLMGLAMLLMFGHMLLDVPPRSFVAMTGLLLIALVIGHLLGGPDPHERTALAITCSTRHVGLAVLVAASMPGPYAVLLITAYLLCSLIVTVPYLMWRRRSAASG
ncbi:bile acid:sodium symporter family protein [Niveibacterium microcysteis]|uniref:Na+-dependent transporter n=1 Tax=Niveibacterium microcysteis TaxID=2811415 RepID=A0ABX7M510_9RHOO|nr:hypothetical protein [Niveibacterium microcysteis]QSI76021.1 hypothetical protein JY500_16300 [Niveibacterium microcysteis]